MTSYQSASETTAQGGSTIKVVRGGVEDREGSAGERTGGEGKGLDPINFS